MSLGVPVVPVVWKIDSARADGRVEVERLGTLGKRRQQVGAQPVRSEAERRDRQRGGELAPHLAVAGAVS